MAIDRFDRVRFEAALPYKAGETVQALDSKPYTTRIALWTPLGLQDGEYTYLLPVAGTPFAIKIRSSVDSTGIAGSAGEDSIRCWIVLQETGEPWGSKLARYVTRQPGWEERLTYTLRELWKWSLAIEKCPVCGEWMKVFRVKKSGPHKGHIFIKCVAKIHAGEGPMKWPKVT